MQMALVVRSFDQRVGLLGYTGIVVYVYWANRTLGYTGIGLYVHCGICVLGYTGIGLYMHWAIRALGYTGQTDGSFGLFTTPRWQSLSPLTV